MPACTMPKIPFLRDWYNREFEDLCEIHDLLYELRFDKGLSDDWLVENIRFNGHPYAAFFTRISLFFVGWFYYSRAGKKYVTNGVG